MPPSPKLKLQNGNAERMAEEIFGSGVEVTGASYSGWAPASAIWSDGDSLGSAVLPGDSGVILSTGRASDVFNRNGPANASPMTSTDTPGVDSDPGFDALAGAPTRDAAWLDVSFVPDGDLLTMRFVFASDEYPEYVGSAYNDMIGVWINGSPVPFVAGDGRVAVTNINPDQNANLFVDNASGVHGTEMDGFTLSLTLTVPVIRGEENEIRIGIADVRDSVYDTNLLIAGGSVQTTLVADADRIGLDGEETATLDVLANDVNTTGGALVITHINGVPVAAGDSVTLASGQVVTLNADGTLDIDGHADDGPAHFTYGVSAVDASGATLQTDIGMVTLEQAPCFVAGTLIRTPVGDRPVETLEPGDLVFTADGGAQPLRWVGRRTVPAEGAWAPIHIDALTFGPHRALLLSPLHRVLIRDALAELMFGDTEVLVAARDLVNDRSVRPRPGGTVTYVHILFDRHQLVWSNGLLTESFHPGPCTANAFEAEALAEITGLFPELDLATGRGYGPTARRALRRFEARALAPRSRPLSWLALRTEPPRIDGARLVPDAAAPLDWPVARGTLLLDWRFEPSAAHLPLLDYAARAPWDAGVTLRFGRDRLHLEVRQGPARATASLHVDAASAVHGYLVSFDWDGPGRRGRLALLHPDGCIAAETTVAAPPPLTMRDVTRICADRTLCRVAPGVAMVAAADHALPAGPWPGLTVHAPVMTDAGPSRLGRLRVGDLVRCTDGGMAQVRWLAGLELPASGVLAPVRMLSPYMGLSCDISALGAQQFELTGSDVEYLFDTDRVRCTASQLLRSAMAQPEPAPVLMRYVSPVLDRPALLDVAGLGCETLRPGPEALHPQSVLARMPRTLCPREEAAPPRALRDFEAVDLLHSRSAA